VVDARTPVVVGAGQVTNRRQHLVDPMTLMEAACRAADSDAAGGALSRVRSVRVVNIVSARYGAPATALAARLSLPDGERITTTVGGSTPIAQLCEVCDAVAAGELDGALIAGAEAVDSARRARREGTKIHNYDAKQAPPDPVVGDARAPLTEADLKAQLLAPATIYPMFEQALAAEAGRTPDEQRIWLGELMAPFTSVAASHPDVSWFPRVLSPAQVSTVTPDNRMIAEPYPKNMNAIIQVDMAAALIVLSAEAAEAAGVPRDRWVFPVAGARCDDVFIAAQRPDFTASPGLGAAAKAVFDAATVGIDDVTHFDLYSCFPSAVQLGAGALGVALDDARGLTVTGGLPFFGGPGNNYVTQSIATMAATLREQPQALGAVTGISWFMSKHGIALLSGAPPARRWRTADTTRQQAEIEATSIEIASEADGVAVVDAFTVEHDREAGPVRAPVYATLEDGRRVVAVPAAADLPGELCGRGLVGEKVRVRTEERGVVYELV
jgi:acetyl-CoA C-acetyltransferase